MKLYSFFTMVLLGFLPAWMQAQCFPSVILQNGLSIHLRPWDSDNDGTTDAAVATLRLRDLVVRTINPCSTQPLDLGFTKYNITGPFPTDTVLQFNCIELGVQSVWVWVRDGNGTTKITEAYVLVQDNKDYCGPVPSLSTGCAVDVLEPEIAVLNGISMNLIPDGAGGGIAMLPAGTMVVSKQDNCSKFLRYRIAQWDNPSQLVSVATFNCNSLGTQGVDIWARDGNGNWTFASTYVIIQDNLGLCGPNAAAAAVGCTPDQTPPTLILRSGLAAPFTQGLASTLNVQDFILKATDNCTKPSNFRIVKKGQSNGQPPTGTTVTFDCSELGTQQVEVWVRDAAGNWAFTDTYVNVQMTGSCDPEPRPQASAKRLWPEYLDAVVKKSEKR